MEKLKYVSPKYQEQLDNLAATSCERFIPEEEQFELDLNLYAEIADIVIERPLEAQLGRTMLNRWCDMGNYTVDI